jgi:hypothetical protein
VIWVRRKQIYFCKWDWTTQITLIRFKKIAPRRRARSPDEANGSVQSAARWRNPGLHPRGEIPEFAEPVIGAQSRDPLAIPPYAARRIPTPHNQEAELSWQADASLISNRGRPIIGLPPTGLRRQRPS